MDPGVRTPLVDFFRRGEVARDVRLVAAEGAFAPRALDQLALLLILKDDADPEIAGAAAYTIDRLPRAALEAFIGRTDVPGEMRQYFTALGFTPGGVVEDAEAPLIDTAESEPVQATPTLDGAPEAIEVKALSALGVLERMKLATRGTREQRSVLVRDPNRLVAAAVLSSPKLTESEVEQFAKMANVAEDVLRVIGTNRAWTKNYGVIAGLVRNPKTPLAISMTLLQRINDRDVKLLAIDRNIPDPLRIAARKRATASRSS
ncbi:MAG: hypothetical protein JJE40_12370 [Vicinamibacteria bacterium]|nr:hypothetical protein [Vicinamibacteria bacterium]